jgi:hypothetical protein
MTRSADLSLIRATFFNTPHMLLACVHYGYLISHFAKSDQANRLLQKNRFRTYISLCSLHYVTVARHEDDSEFGDRSE